MPRKNALDFEAIRRRIREEGGRRYWRSLDELAETDEFLEYLHREFPQQASRWLDETSRRGFLKLMAASLALAGLSGCGEEPNEQIVPYVRMPEEVIPGKPLYFATAAALAGTGIPLVVESHMGRPTKIEGNPDHPATLGAGDLFAQASILTLYDPDRSQVVMNDATISTHEAFLGNVAPRLETVREQGGRGLRILTECVLSPTLAAQLQQLQKQFPEANWNRWTPVCDEMERQGAALAFGDQTPPLEPIYHFDRADVILSFDHDFLSMGSTPIRYAWDFMQRRRVTAGAQPGLEMNRLYVVEPTRTLAGAKADHRLPLQPQEIVALAFEIAQRVGVAVELPAGLPALPASDVWIDALVDDLKNYRRQSEPGASLVLAGRYQPPIVHALVHAMNDALGNVGTTVEYIESPAAIPLPGDSRPPAGDVQSLHALVEEMQAGQVEVLVILGGNPVFTAPADLGFADALERVPLRIHLGEYRNETARACHWHLPETHYLEAWSDVRMYDGSISLTQPLISRLYRSWSPHELLATLLGDSNRSDYDVVRAYWRERYQGEDFETFWTTALYHGSIPDTAAPVQSVSLQADLGASIGQAAGEALPSGDGSDGYDVVFRPDPSIWDGRFINNAWLQELPKPFTKLTWDNAAIVNPATADRLQLADGDVVELAHNGRTLRVPVTALPGQPDRCITLYFGYGSDVTGFVGRGTGFDVYGFRTSDAPWFLSGVEIRKTGERYPLATTQHHHLLNPEVIGERHLIREGTLAELRAHPDHPPFVHPQHGAVEAADRQTDADEGGLEQDIGVEHPSLYPEWNYDGYRWGMVVNQTTCIGCNSCVVACQSENNIPVVGKTEVIRGREMHWLRIDSYYKGDLENPETYFQPVPCMHCEKAPCEVVCPVTATTHSEEGINEMTYNRCVGTRYCSNNCPYKVRRFNYLSYTEPFREHPTLRMLQNPNVTVRSTGVMEKCTYCIQRINETRINAKTEDRRIRAGELQTACQQACPTEAIIFGDLNDPEADVHHFRQDPLNYALLGELNTQPRTTYLAAVHNPNPRILEAERHGHTV